MSESTPLTLPTHTKPAVQEAMIQHQTTVKKRLAVFGVTALVASAAVALFMGLHFSPRYWIPQVTAGATVLGLVVPAGMSAISAAAIWKRTTKKAAAIETELNKDNIDWSAVHGLLPSSVANKFQKPS